MKLTNKQIDVFKSYAIEEPKILICSGAKRSGKTFVLILLFVAMVKSFENMGVSFIIGGSTLSSIQRNILNDLEMLLGISISLDKTNAFELYGNKVYCFDGSNSDAWKKVRGFTAAGAYLNEATALHDTFIKECLSRCSYKGARVLIDTNPENPMHTVKTDYIDKDGQRLESGRLNIKVFNFSLYDNNFLDDDYIQSIVSATPSGMYTDRDINGIWVAAEGVVYKDFNMHRHYISREELSKINMVSYYAGVDWGYEHYGTIAVVGEDDQGNTYVVKEIAKQHEEIEYYVEEAKKIVKEYGNINFYCDTARPEYIQRFRKEGLKARKADKAVLSGIEVIARMFKQNKLFIVDDVVRFKEEVFMYVWNSKTGEPVKQFDDFLDSLRYAIYTHNKAVGVTI